MHRQKPGDAVQQSGQFGGWTDNETDPTTNVSPNQRVPKRRFALVRMGFRDYDPAKGRFLERDPIDYAGGINLYAYAGNNPITHADPSGLQTPGVVLLQQEAAKEAGYKAGQYVTEKAAQQAAAKGVATVATRTLGTRILAATGVGLGIGARALPVVRTVMGLHAFYNWANGLSQEYLTNISVSPEDVEADQGRKQKRIVIGETMKDIFPSAKFYEADYYHAWKQEEFNFDLAMKRNRAWIRRKIKEGYTFFDIGLDSKRQSRSPFYAMELEELKRAGVYGNTRHYRKARIRQ